MSILGKAILHLLKISISRIIYQIKGFFSNIDFHFISKGVLRTHHEWVDLSRDKNEKLMLKRYSIFLLVHIHVIV